MQVIKGDQTVFFDVDDTLVMWNKIGEDTKLPFDNYGSIEMLTPHQVHIDELKAHKQMGKTIVVWSQGGWEWCKSVVETLELEEFVDVCMNKPDIYYDDLAPVWWMQESRNDYKEFKDVD